MSDGNVYAVMGSYEDDLALAKNRNGKLGYIGRNGRANIDFKFDQADSFDRGYAMVSIAGRWGLIDVNGKEVIPIQYRSPGEVYAERDRRGL